MIFVLCCARAGAAAGDDARKDLFDHNALALPVVTREVADGLKNLFYNVRENRPYLREYAELLQVRENALVYLRNHRFVAIDRYVAHQLAGLPSDARSRLEEYADGLVRTADPGEWRFDWIISEKARAARLRQALIDLEGGRFSTALNTVELVALVDAGRRRLLTRVAAVAVGENSGNPFSCEKARSRVFNYRYLYERWRREVAAPELSIVGDDMVRYVRWMPRLDAGRLVLSGPYRRQVFGVENGAVLQDAILSPSPSWAPKWYWSSAAGPRGEYFSASVDSGRSFELFMLDGDVRKAVLRVDRAVTMPAFVDGPGDCFAAYAYETNYRFYRQAVARIRGGEVVWSANIGSTHGAETSENTPAALGAGGGRFFALSNHGLLVRLDADRGEIVWAAKYPRTEQGGRYFPPEPPLVAGGAVLVAPMDSTYLAAFEAETGELLWVQPREGMTYLLGSDGERVYLQGRSVVGIALDRSKPPVYSAASFSNGAARAVFTEYGIMAVDKREFFLLEKGSLRPIFRARAPFDGNLIFNDPYLAIAGRENVALMEFR